MYDELPYQLLTDAVLMLHVAVAGFVVVGLVLVVIGNLRRWRWVNVLAFRLAHLVVIAIVAAQAWRGAVCPLTALEMRLRERAHAATYSGSFIEHWLERVLYYEAPPWAFPGGYSLFGLVVVAAWLYFPPAFKPRSKAGGT